MHRRITRSTLAVAMVALAVLWLAPSSMAAPKPGGDSPQAVFDRFSAAAEASDWNELAACMAPEGLQTMNAMFVAMGGMMVAFSEMGEGMAEEMAGAFGEEGEAEEAEVEAAPEEVGGLMAEFEALLARYGIDEESMGDPDAEDAEMPEAFSSPELFSDLMQFMQMLPSDGDDSGPGEMFSIPEGGLVLEDLVIDGDRATASVGDEPGEFVRIDGRWYIDMDMGMGGGEDMEMDSDMEMEMEMEEEAAE